MDRGNYGYLEGDVFKVDGSKLDLLDNGKTKMWRSSNPTVDDPQIFKAIEVTGDNGKTWLRNSDSEYKMLNKLAERLGAKRSTDIFPDVRGNMKVISENPYCKSCQGVLQQFNEMFPNLKLTLIDGAK